MYNGIYINIEACDKQQRVYLTFIKRIANFSQKATNGEVIFLRKKKVG